MGQYIDMTGLHYGKLTVIERAENTKNGGAQWRCQCECGNEVVVCGNYLRSGHTKSCGKCIHHGTITQDLTGQRFGRLVVVGYHGHGNHTSLWDCVCDCGCHTVSSMSNLKNGHTQSCGCLSRE